MISLFLFVTTMKNTQYKETYVFNIKWSGISESLIHYKTNFFVNFATIMEDETNVLR